MRLCVIADFVPLNRSFNNMVAIFYTLYFCVMWHRLPPYANLQKISYTSLLINKKKRAVLHFITNFLAMHAKWSAEARRCLPIFVYLCTHEQI